MTARLLVASDLTNASNLTQYFASATDASIRAAALNASSNGGGVVKIPAGTITLSSPLPVYQGVIYEGAPMLSQIAGGATAGNGGTILQPVALAISSGTYVSGTGVITLTMTTAVTFGVNASVGLASLTGTGAFANLNTITYALNNGNEAANWTTIATTSGTTVTIQGPIGLGAATITGGNLFFDGMDYNNVDQAGPYANATLFLATAVYGCGVKNITFVGFNYGIKLGASYIGGPFWGRFEDLYFVDCLQWGFWCENYGECYSKMLEFNNNQLGQLARVGSATSIYNVGNSVWIQCQGTKSTQLQRGFVWWTRNASNITQESTFAEGVSGPGFSTVSQAATMANTSANIAVVDGTKFPVDMPVTFSANANGFFQLQSGLTVPRTYFVVSNNGSNTITLSDTVRGSAITATGNTAVSIRTKGFCNMEAVGFDGANTLLALSISAMDLEGTASAHLLLQNVISRWFVGSGALAGGDVYNTYVLRTAKYGILDDLTQITPDADSNSANNIYQLQDPTSVNGVNYNIGPISIAGLGGTANINFANAAGTAADVFFQRTDASILGIHDNTSPAGFKAFNTYGTAKEWFNIRWNGSNQAIIGTDFNGGGSARSYIFEVGGVNIADVGIGTSNGFYFYNDTFFGARIVTNNLSFSGAPSNAGTVTNAVYVHLTSGVVFAFNATGANYGSIATNGANLWGLGSSANGNTQSTNSVQWDGKGNAFLGSGSIATNATDGFSYMPTCAGAPSGVPTTQSGFAASVYDTTNNKIWVYNGSWRGVVVT